MEKDKEIRIENLEFSLVMNRSGLPVFSVKGNS